MSKIEILILEHDPNDIELLQYELKKSGLEYNYKIVDNKEDFETALSIFKPHIILSDYSLPSFDGLAAFKIKSITSPEVPFIIVSGTIGDEKSVELIKLGVTDYVLKEKMYQVTHKILRALKEANDRQEKKNADNRLADSEKKYRQLFQLSPIPMWVFDPETYRFLDVNEAAIRHYGYSLEEFLSITVKDIRPAEDMQEFKQTVELNKLTQSFFKSTFRHIKKNGEIIYVNIQSNVIDFEGKKARIILATDITERINYIQAIEQQNKKLNEIAWMQSHVVRAPLARIMGLIDCINNCQSSTFEVNEMLKHVLKSAVELDNIIREIVNKTEKVKVNQSNEFESISGR